MPNTNQRTSQLQTWDPDGKEAVRNEEMGFLNSNIDTQTAGKRKNQNAVEYLIVLWFRCPIFNPEQEQELMQHILEREKRFHGLTLKYIRKLAFQLIEHNKVKHNFNRHTEMAGKALTTVFRKLELTLRSSEATPDHPYGRGEV